MLLVCVGAFPQGPTLACFISLTFVFSGCVCVAVIPLFFFPTIAMLLLCSHLLLTQVWAFVPTSPCVLDKSFPCLPVPATVFVLPYMNQAKKKESDFLVG